MKGEQTLQKLRGKSRLYLKKNGSTILTCVGAVGVVATGVSAVKATPKAMRLLEVAKEEKGEELTKLETVKAAGTAYIPTLVIGVSAIACIFGANVLNKRQQAALVSAYAFLDSSYKDYKKKVEELYGEGANVQVRNELAKDKYEKEDIELEDDKQLFYDEFSKQYFESTMTDVVQAEYNLNRQLYVNGGAYLNEFYESLDIPTIPAGQELGWSTGILESHYWATWIEFDHTPVEMDDGLECTIITMRYEPVIDFAYY